MRGGTSKALIFHARDLPPRRADWAPLFLAAMGSPDPNGRQLNGMGGGVSSVSKVCVVGPPSRTDADVDYTFAQVQVGEANVDYSGNCGNMSSAIGPFAVDEGLVAARGAEATVRIHNTNTNKIIHATFPVAQERALVEGELSIPGVAGAGAPVRLDFLQPGGATTGTLLPTGRSHDTLDVAGHSFIEASMVDAANACVFVGAEDVGLTGVELPAELESRPDVLETLAAIREAASVAMRITASLEEARARRLTPFVVVVSPPQGRSHHHRREAPGRGCRPDCPRDLQRPAAPGPAADRLALHRRGRPHPGQRRPEVLPHLCRFTAAARNAVRRAERGRGGYPPKRPMDGGARHVLPHRPPPL